MSRLVLFFVTFNLLQTLADARDVKQMMRWVDRHRKRQRYLFSLVKLRRELRRSPRRTASVLQRRKWTKETTSRECQTDLIGTTFFLSEGDRRLGNSFRDRVSATRSSRRKNSAKQFHKHASRIMAERSRNHDGDNLRLHNAHVLRHDRTQAVHRGFTVEFLRDATGTIDLSNEAGDVTPEELHRSILTVSRDGRLDEAFQIAE